MPDYSLETALKSEGYSHICGIDEAGRGPLAGPVCAAAVVLPIGLEIEGLNDSKKLTEKKREALFDKIMEQATDYSIAFATVAEIEEYNILSATFLAMKRAAEGLKTPSDYALIDGNKIPNDFNVPATAVVKGDSKSCSISAASILAKVSRDRLMSEYDALYPQYGFLKHKGYGTAAHYKALIEHGLSPVHRPSFLKNLDDHR